MAAILLALVLSVVAGGIGWLLLGNRFAFDPDEKQNEILNVAAYVALAFPLLFVLLVIWAP